jgi:hypothetical protein
MKLNRQTLFHKKKVLGMILGFFTILLVLGSVGAQIAIQNDSINTYFNVEAIVL